MAPWTSVSPHPHLSRIFVSTVAAFYGGKTGAMTVVHPFGYHEARQRTPSDLRLGRVLRAKEGKRALLYELVTKDTMETYTSERRREHSAYGR